MSKTILEALNESPAGLTLEELVKATKLTKAQVNKELPYLPEYDGRYYCPVSTPHYATSKSAAADCHTLEDRTILPGETVRVVSNLRIPANMPDGAVIIIAARSSTPSRHGLRLTNGIGIIDPDYPEFVMFEYENVSTTRTAKLAKGTAIGQALAMPTIELWPRAQKERDGGFGSTDA